ncbi:MAG: tRNA uridine-5-carboxymethylaminomethyl(34) synthesis GTPase MnmE, partial [Pseudomonadota bacterium]
MSSDTIYALSSAPGKAAVSLVRASGPMVPTLLLDLIGRLPEPRLASRCKIRKPDQGEIIDDGLVLFFPGPASATGEDVAEFHVHGGRAVLQALYDAFSAFPDCRPAEPGEFSLRGFENGKLDLTAAEGIADLVDADTEAQRKQAQRQASGHLVRRYDHWREQIIEAQALIEADIDFSDEGDVDDHVYRASRQRVEVLSHEIECHLKSASRGEIIRSGYRVVIAGPTNAGKSSLLNALAERDVAIVSEQAGTTRDVIEVHLDLAGYPVVVSDTAGVRETQDL